MKNKHKLALNLFIVFAIVCAVVCFIQIKNNKINCIEEVTEINQNEKVDRLVSDNEAHIMARAMTLVVNNIDEDGELIEESVQYSISAFNSNNVTNSSNPNGILSQTLNMPTSSGQFTINLTQTKSASGYTSTVATKQITVDFAEVNGVMNITSCSCGEGLELISNNSLSIKVKWLNKKVERELIPIMFVNEDENGDELNGAVFTIKDNEMLKIVEIEKDGCVLVEIPSPAEAKTQKYKVEQITAVDGYSKIKGESELYIKYELVNGKMTATEVYFSNVDSTKVKVTHFTGILTQLTFVNSAKTEQEEDDDDVVAKEWKCLVINNKNSNGDNLVGGKFIFKDSEGIKQEGIISEDGPLIFEFLSPNTPGIQTYKIEQVVASNGYCEINGEFELIVSYTLLNGKIVIDSANIDIVGDADITAESNGPFTIEVTFINEEQQEDIAERELISFLIANQNKNGDALNGATFSIKAEDDSEQVGIIKDGVALFQLLSPNKAGKQTYRISQVSAADGYKIINGEMEFSVVYGVEDGKIVLEDAGVNVVGSSNISVDNIDGVMVQLTIINEEETQEVSYDALTSFKVVNKNKNGDIIEGGSFSVKFDNREIILEPTTVQLFSIKLGSLKEEKEYTLEQLTVADGYNKINGEIKIIVEHEIVDNKSKTNTARLSVVGNDNIQVEVLKDVLVVITIINEEQGSEEEGQEETFDQELISFLISNKNKNGDELNGATFAITSEDDSQEVGIIKDGVAVFQLLSPNKEGKQTYKVEQLTAAEGYSKINGEMEFTVTYKVEDGKIVIEDAGINVIGTDNFSVENIDGVMIQLTVINEEEKEDVVEKELMTFLVINKSQNGDYLEGAKFSIKQGEDGIQIGETRDGYYEFKILSPNEEGTQTYKIEQLTAADGYNKINGEFELVVTYKIVDGKVEIDSADLNIVGDVGISIGEVRTHDFQLIFINEEQEEETYERELVSFLIANKNKNGDVLNGATFRITSEDDSQEVGIIKDGVAVFQLLSPNKAGEQLYLIEQLTAADGYSIIGGKMRFVMQYDVEDGKIKISSAEAGLAETEYVVVDNIDGVMVQLTIISEEEKEDEVVKEFIPFKIVNKNQNNEVLEGASFSLKVGEDGVQIGKVKDGVAIFQILSPNKDGKQTYKVEQLTAVDGYTKIDGEFEIEVEYEVVDGKIEIKQVSLTNENITEISVEKTEAGEVEVIFINKEEEQEPVQEESISFLISNENKNGDALNGATFSVEAEDENQQVGIVKDGVALFQITSPTEAGVQKYIIEQLTSADGYSKINGQCELLVEYEIKDGKIQVKNAEFNVIGNDDIKVHNFEGVLIELVFVNEEEKADDVLKELITFTLKNQNENGDFISGAKFQIKSGDQSADGIVDNNGELVFKLLSPNEEKTEKYIIEQISATDGYALIGGECELSVEYKIVDGKIVVNNVFTNMIGDYGLKVKDFEADKVNVIFVNLEKENENDPDVEIKTIPFKVITQDKEGNNIVESTEYIISELLDDGKKTYSAKSDNDGVLTVQVQMPVAAGVVRYSVQQVKQPNGYVQDTNEYEIQLEYQDNNGTISFVNAEALVECTYCLKVSNCTDTLIETIFVNKRVGEPVKLDVNGIDGAEIDGDFIDKIKVSTSLKDFVESLSVDGSIEVFDAKGNKIDLTDPSTENLKMGTGFKIQINEAGTIVEKEVIVVGDYNGDGIITISDVAAANKYFLGAIPNSEKLDKSFDITGDGKVTISDVGKLNKYYLGAIPRLTNN